MGEKRELGLAEPAKRMIHHLEKQRLDVREIAGDVKREVLPISAGQRVVTREHALYHEYRNIRMIALANDILPRVNCLEPEWKRSNSAFVRGGQSTVRASSRN